MTSKNTQYTPDYIKKCFVAWYSAGRPNKPSEIVPILSPDEHGRIPAVSQIAKWRKRNRWDEQADDLDEKANAIVEVDLVNRKAELLIKQAQDASEIAEKAKAHLTTTTFDSSAAAVTAYFKSTEEIRNLVGISQLAGKVGKMSNDEIIDEIAKRLVRAVENNQVIEGKEIREDEESNEE